MPRATIIDALRRASPAPEAIASAGRKILRGCASGATLACAAGPVSPAHAEILPGMPDAIVCSVKDPTGMLQWERLVYYASARMVDGRTLYKTLTSDPVVLLVSAEGIIDGANLADCDGRNVKTLLDEGRAFMLATPGPTAGDGARERR